MQDEFRIGSRAEREVQQWEEDSDIVKTFQWNVYWLDLWNIGYWGSLDPFFVRKSEVCEKYIGFAEENVTAVD
jgi:hypothetical protein